jgi:hypothetical protein
VKHTDLIRALRKLARERGLDLKDGGGTNHEKWQAGGAIAIVPRHKEIGEHLARKIIKDFGDDLEEDEEN